MQPILEWIATRTFTSALPAVTRDQFFSFPFYYNLFTYKCSGVWFAGVSSFESFSSQENPVLDCLVVECSTIVYIFHK